MRLAGAGHLDEPTTGVDPLSRRQFWELIEAIRAERQWMSVLVSTAYMEEAEAFDWLIAMDAGRILATGTPAGVGAGFDPPRFLRPGDVVSVEVEGVGVLTTHVVPASKL